MTRTRKCENPRHELTQRDQPRPIVNPYFVIPPGRGYAKRRYCSEVCAQVARDIRKAERGTYNVPRQRKRTTILSLDKVMAEGGDPFTLADTDHIRPLYEATDPVLQPAITYPLDGFGFAEYSIQFTYFPAPRAHALLGNIPSDWLVFGEATVNGKLADIIVIRTQHRPTGKYVDLSYSDPFVIRLRDMLTSDEWEDRYAGWLRELRRAASVGLFAGPTPVIPPDESDAAVLN